MKGFFSRPQFLLILGGVALVVLILLLPRNPDKEDAIASPEPIAKLPEFEDILAHAKTEIGEASKGKIEQLERSLELATSEESKAAVYDSLAVYWRVLKQPAIESHYLEQVAESRNSIEAWFLAGDSYFNSYRNVAQPMKRGMIQKAIYAYNQVLMLDENNLEALNALGVSYVEGSGDLGEPPMRGIGMIKSVLEKDPENIDALVNLGYFAIKSGQYEKAIERFKQVLKIDSNQIESYLYLTDIYVSLEDMDKAISHLNIYKGFINDDLKIKQIDAYIEELKKQNKNQ